MIRPDTQAYVDRVVDPELLALRAERDRLAHLWATRQQLQTRRARLTHEGFLVLSAYARWAMAAQVTGRELGAAGAYALLHQNGHGRNP
jgi:hypothetical protein